MKITKKHVFSFLILSLVFSAQMFIFNFSMQPAQADETLFDNQTGMDDIGAVYGGEKMDIRIIVARLIVIMLGFVGTIFIILLVIAGYRYMMSSGNEEKVRTATGQIKTSIIGLAITMAAWAISRFVLLRIKAAVDNRVDLFYPM